MLLGGLTMKRISAVVIALAATGFVHALYMVSNKGEWPASWPKELEPLRKQARTLVGPVKLYRHYAIPFTTREEFEAAWPHLLTVRAKGAQLILNRGGNFFLGDKVEAGVVVRCPPFTQTGRDGAPDFTGRTATAKELAHDAISIELVVDGTIVDLNRIPLPADTPISDERFKKK